jgi:hypothetical protein
MRAAIGLSAAIFGFFISISLSPAVLHGATLEKVNASYGAISGSMLPIWVAKEGRLF